MTLPCFALRSSMDTKSTGSHLSFFCNGLLQLLAIFEILTCIYAITSTDVQAGSHSLKAEVSVPGNVAVRELLDCYNARTSNHTMTFKDYYDGRPPQSLRLHRVWWSSQDTTLPLTIFTFVDISRLKALAAQCRSFPGGPLSAAVYVPLIQKPIANISTGAQDPTLQQQQGPGLAVVHQDILRNATDTLVSLFQEMEDEATKTGACALRLLLIYELVADDVMAVLMPINPLRNAAMLGATTPLAAMVDADLSISQGLAGRLLADLSEGSRVHQMLTAAEQQEKVAWVMPAWDTNRHLDIGTGNAVADAVIAVPPTNKRTLMEMWKMQDIIWPFAFDVFKLGHNTTDYDRWLQTDAEYTVYFQKRYEPWFISPRKVLPVYDARFRGYGANKALHLVDVAESNFTFRVLPDVWLVHRPHEPTASCYIYNTLMKPSQAQQAMSRSVFVFGRTLAYRQAVVRINNYIFDTSVKEIANHVYRPVMDDGAQRCRDTLSWWR